MTKGYLGYQNWKLSSAYLYEASQNLLTVLTNNHGERSVVLESSVKPSCDCPCHSQAIVGLLWWKIQEPLTQTNSPVQLLQGLVANKNQVRLATSCESLGILLNSGSSRCSICSTERSYHSQRSSAFVVKFLAKMGFRAKSPILRENRDDPLFTILISIASMLRLLVAIFIQSFKTTNDSNTATKQPSIRNYAVVDETWLANAFVTS